MFSVSQCFKYGFDFVYFPKFSVREGKYICSRLTDQKKQRNLWVLSETHVLTVGIVNGSVECYDLQLHSNYIFLMIILPYSEAMPQTIMEHFGAYIVCYYFQKIVSCFLFFPIIFFFFFSEQCSNTLLLENYLPIVWVILWSLALWSFTLWLAFQCVDCLCTQSG